jgi:hypothetical protein
MNIEEYKKDVKPIPKFNIGDLVERKSTRELLIIKRNNAFRKVGGGPWKPIYDFCPLKKNQTGPDMRKWNSWKSFNTDIDEDDLILIKIAFYSKPQKIITRIKL